VAVLEVCLALLNTDYTAVFADGAGMEYSSEITLRKDFIMLQDCEHINSNN
jgi:hypothetical protein